MIEQQRLSGRTDARIVALHYDARHRNAVCVAGSG
jgi:hypothetical protein